MITIKGVKYMSDFEAKNAIIDIGKRMYSRGFVAANDGNITCRVGPNAIWATPTGVSKGFMKPEMLVKMDLNGKVLQGTAKPSSEVKMHLRVYAENPECMGVTHAHPPIATAYAVAGIPLEKPILTEGVLNLGVVPIAKYATPGTQEVPDSVAPFCRDYNACLLANHGALSWGKDVYEAFFRLEAVEYYASLLMYTGNIIGQQHPLSCDQVQTLMDNRIKYGITTGGTPPCACDTTNNQDIISEIRPGSGYTFPMAAPNPMAAPVQVNLKGVTPVVKPGMGSAEPISCGCGSLPLDNIPEVSRAKSKEEIIAEVVRRVTAEMNR